ncbi:hypothetical protein B5F09_06190 [Erysipelatoclostridium sp. An173]|uniref:DpnD/PcfM family protein n=1 Tax=Erysipelatoclostridium sp. An173 TaxID=1965571 RepID=UPI000B3813E0|nr:DpnD/PcfM family protein [Erysipelatoclostridium sp. An173]OUP77369.1 hypothetical protein B5F09_06190 [Erysipelatoclostridium sp. An173]
MKNYKITILEHLSKDFTVVANSKDEALVKVKEMYDDCEIILYPEDCDVITEYVLNEND